MTEFTAPYRGERRTFVFDDLGEQRGYWISRWRLKEPLPPPLENEWFTETISVLGDVHKMGNMRYVVDMEAMEALGIDTKEIEF